MNVLIDKIVVVFCVLKEDVVVCFVFLDVVLVVWKIVRGDWCIIRLIVCVIGVEFCKGGFVDIVLDKCVDML